jgi:micrococcal nuclease
VRRLWRGGGRKLHLRHFIPTILVLFLTLPALAADFTGKVVSVSDGDTLTVLHNGRGEKIRLYGIDCPEDRQPFSTAAKHFTSELAFDKTVTVVSKGKDRHGRTVADVFLPDDRLLVGFAWWFKRYALGDETLKQLEAEARKAKRGCGLITSPYRPGSGGERSGQPPRRDDRNNLLHTNCPPTIPTRRSNATHELVRRTLNG